MFLVLGVLFTLLAVSCSTKKNKWNRRVYHNLTGHYNAYFNGEQALKEAVKSIAAGHKDDYTEVLDVFPLGTPETIGGAGPNLDRSITKASIVIHKHSMYFGKKEYVKWVYYSYLMMGQARFYKQEYGTAKQVFRYITTRYPKEAVKQDAMLWIALIESIQGNYGEAISQLDAIRGKVNKGQVSKEAYRMFPQVYADVYLRQENYDAALPYLKMAVDRANNKTTKARMLFILAQVEQKESKLRQASQHYLKVVSRNPSYEMDFNARMNMAKCYDGGDSRVILKKMNKMLKDPKNEEYQDQIYYVLAEIALKDGDKNLAINYLQLSVRKSMDNDKQKAFSSMKLADIYFEEQEYTNAQAYYDSTMLFLPTDYPDYDVLSKRKKDLTELVSSLVVIQAEDSLQNLANMSERQRNVAIEGFIQAEIREEQHKAKEERERQEALRFLQENRQSETQLQSVTNRKAASWYFYNSNSVSAGYAEFSAKWGARKLADNWRLSDKEVISFDDGQQEEGLDADSTATQETNVSASVTNKKSKEYYLQNVPLTPAMMDTSNARIEEALFVCGLVYKEKLMNNTKAIESFDELLRRFPTGKYTDQAYYNLYSIYMVEGNKGDAKFYMKKLIKEYPESEYAKILQDPDYFKKLKEEADLTKVLYKETYLAYNSGDCNQVQRNCEKAKKEYPDNVLELSKFELLNALCVGKSRDTSAFILALEKVIYGYPGTEAEVLATEIMQQLKTEMVRQQEAKMVKQTDDDKTGAGVEKTKPKKTSTSIFVSNPDEKHMFLVLADRRSVKVSELQNRISDHNKKYYGTEDLKVSSIPINDDIVLIGVSKFENDKAAMEYFRSARRNSLLYVLLKKNGGNYFIISAGNYSRLYKSKDIEGYREFYNQEYPEGK